MKKRVNLISFDLRAYLFNVEQISEQSRTEIRYMGIPCRENDATMYHFFQKAYPSQLQNVPFADMKNCIESDAEPSKNYYVGAGRICFQNACYITRNVVCKDVEKETQQVLSKIYAWLEPDALTLIDLPKVVVKNEVASANWSVQQIKSILEQMAIHYNCVAIQYQSCIENECRLDSIKIPYLCWNRIRDPKAKTILEQLQSDEMAYQEHIVELIQEKTMR